MHGKCSCNCSDARRGREDDHRCNVDGAGGGEADASRRFILHTCGKSVPNTSKEPEVIGYIEKAKKPRCKCWFCKNESCLKASGRKLLGRLLPVLETFQALLMLTLTVDPKNFSSPLEAFKYLKKKRCVAKTIDALFQAGVLKSRRYFYVIEWQMGKGDEQGTEMPHFHVLVEAEFVDFQALAAAWGSFRPKDAPPPTANAPGFGHVRISKSRFYNGAHAARYACKYLTKFPEKGHPQWVTKAKLQIKRFSTSRKLLPSETPKRYRERKPQHAPDCTCTNCELRRERRSTIEERTNKCGQSTILVRVPLLLREDGEVVEGRPRFLGRANIPFADVLSLVGADDEAISAFEVTPSQWEDILRLDESRRGISPAVVIPDDHPLSKPVRREAA